MNAKQRMDERIWAVELAVATLLVAASDTSHDAPIWRKHDLLKAARKYADAMRSLHAAARKKP